MHFGGHFEFWPKEKVSRNFWEVHGSLFSLKWVYNAKSSEKKMSWEVGHETHKNDSTRRPLANEYHSLLLGEKLCFAEYLEMLYGAF